MSKMALFTYLIAVSAILISIAKADNLYQHDVICNTTNCSLSAAFNDLRNDTRLRLQAGRYLLNGNVNLFHFANILILGKQDVIIECTGRDIGISFSRSQNIKIERLTITQCGRPHVGTSLFNLTYMAVFNFVYCRDVSFYKVSVTNNRALGVNLYDVGGSVRFISCLFGNNSRDNTENRWGGGGVYMQFTYCGAMNGNGCTQSDNIEHQNYIHNNSYVFKDCNFTNNYAPGPPNIPGTKNTDFLPPKGTDHMSLGRGGGLSFYLRSNASHNEFLIDNCTFMNNYAIWGGGFFTEVVDNCYQNNFIIKGCSFLGNSAKWAGGGMRYGLIQVFDRVKPYINGTIINSTFTNNSAIWGGGSSIYATEEVLALSGKATSQIKFVDVKWIKNFASNGAALGGASWKIITAGGVVVPIFQNTTFKDNVIVDYKLSSTNSSFYSSVVKGQGTICTNAMPFHFDGENYFMDNIGSVFLLTDAVLIVAGSMEFHRNKGHDGGAISLLGQSWINVNPGSRFLFSKNEAMRGAGIFVESPGTPNRVASKNCFLTYNAATSMQTLISPDKWKTFFNFSNNNATVAGHSIYCSTLKYCSWYMEVYGFHNTQLFNWTNFVYENASPSGSEIATDPVEIVLDHEDWMNIAPSDITNPTVRLIDERGQILPGVVAVGVQNTNYSNTQVDVSSGPYFPSDSKIYSLKMSGMSDMTFTVDIQTTTGRAIKAVISNITLKDCRPGYYLKDNLRCVCLKSPEISEHDGITRCQGDRQVFIKKGLWAGLADKHLKSFVTLPCPSMYCDFDCPHGVSCAPHEYLFLDKPHRQCQGHRTGILCGKCLPGYSVVLGSDHCKLCPDNYAWIGYLALFLIIGTLVVVAVLLVNVDISSGYYNGSLFFYQVVAILVREGFSPDLGMRFLMGLVNVQVGMGACMWYGMTDLQKLAFTYVIPTYILLLCGIIILVSRMRRSVFSRRSALRAFTTLFLFSYTTFTSVSLDLLHYTPVHDKKVLYRSGEIEYFGAHHARYGILAIFVFIFIVIPFPLCLLMVQPLSYLRPGLGSTTIKPFLDIVQSCYKTEYRWFAGVYYLARIILLLLYTFVSDPTVKHSLLCFVCIMLLTLQANVRPYQKISSPFGDKSNDGTWINILDSLLLMNLTLVALLGAFSTSNDSWLTSPSANHQEFSPADITCIFLMWLPVPYLVGVIVFNVYTFAKKRFQRAVAMNLNREASVFSDTSDLPS